MKIYKYELGDKHGVDITIPIPLNSKVLYIGEQDGRVVLWAEVPEGALTVDRVFRLAYTGDTPPANAQYIGTVTTIFPVEKNPLHLSTV